jgi:predicted Zn-dependent protease
MTRQRTKQPELWIAMNNLASLLSDHSTSGKDLDRALKFAQNAQKARPEDPSVLDALGWVYYRQNNTQKALEFVKRAKGKTNDVPVIDYHIGTMLYSLGNGSEAKVYLKKASEARESFFGKEEAKKTLGKI